MSKPLTRVLLVAFVVLDAVLVVGVLKHVNRTPPPAGINAVAVTPTATTSTPDSKQTAYKFKSAAAAVISVANDGTILYAERGQCDGDATAKLTVSTNGGASRSRPTTGLQEILAVSAVSRTELRLVGADAACAVKRLMSTDGGDTWTDDLDDSLWYPDPRDSKTVISPDGSSKPGCIVTSLSQVGKNFARVSCADGEVRGTGDGDKWLKLGRLDNIRVASFSTFNAGVALAVYQGCAAQEFTTRDSGRTWAPGGCITGEPAQAIAASDTGLAALVSSQLYVSDDAGKSWSQP